MAEGTKSPEVRGKSSVIVYIWGNLTVDNLTPRAGKDTTGRPGQQPGLSASATIPPGRKAQGIDINKLAAPLRAIPDDIESGGTPGHFAISPVNEAGDVDAELLHDWAKMRESGNTHELTQLVLDAVVEPNAKGKTV